MAYSEFTLKQVKQDFDLTLIENESIFEDITPIKISQHLKNQLDNNVPLALAINTEKARSEFIIAVVLLELRTLLKNQISLFSGIEFNVDKTRHLNGFCDFIISLSAEQLFLTSPVITLVEAKNENIMAGMGQCLAEMVAAQLFNEREENDVETIYGVVTTGSAWKFMTLTHNKMVFIDKKEYHIESIHKIMGILRAMVLK